MTVSDKKPLESMWSMGQVSGVHRFGKKSPPSCQGGSWWRVAPHGWSEIMVSLPWKMYGFHFKKPHKMGHLEVWNHHDMTARWALGSLKSRWHLGTRLILEQLPAPSKKDGPNGGWKTGACVEEALSVKGYVGYVVNQYFAIFLGASFNKLLRIQAMFSTTN